MLPRREVILEAARLQSCNEPAPHNSAAAPQSDSDSTGPQFLAAFLLASLETLRAKAPVSDHSNTARLATVALAARQQDAQRSSASANAAKDDCPCHSRCPSYPAPTIFQDCAPTDRPLLGA